MPETQLKTAAIIFNPIKVDLPAVREAVAREAEAAGWGESLWLETSKEDVGQAVTRRALEQGVDLVIAAGGDGTVRAVAEALRGTNVPLALLPSGTGNLLARNLKLTLGDIPSSLTTAFTGVDLGMIRIERDDKSRDTHAFATPANCTCVCASIGAAQGAQSLTRSSWATAGPFPRTFSSCLTRSLTTGSSISC